MVNAITSPRTTDTNDFDTLVGLIELSETLSDAEKDAMRQTLENEGLTDSLRQQLIAMCDKESAHLDGEIQETERIVDGLKVLAAEENANAQEESERLASLAAQAMDNVANTTSQEISTAVTQFDKSLESHAQSSDAAQADAIKKQFGL